MWRSGREGAAQYATSAGIVSAQAVEKGSRTQRRGERGDPDSLGCHAGDPGVRRGGISAFSAPPRATDR